MNQIVKNISFHIWEAWKTICIWGFTIMILTLAICGGKFTIHINNPFNLF